MSSTQGYAHCVDVYIKQCQEVRDFTLTHAIRLVLEPLNDLSAVPSPQGAYLRNDVFEDTAVLCQRVNKQVGEVFSSPETVMAKLIQNIFENKLQVRFALCSSAPPPAVITHRRRVLRPTSEKNWTRRDTLTWNSTSRTSTTFTAGTSHVHGLCSTQTIVPLQVGLC